MNDNFRSIGVSVRMILKDPINLMLTLIPTVIALALYAFTVVWILENSDILVVSLRGYMPSAESATVLGKLLTALLVVFVFILMSWTFVIVVGLIAAPFNSMLSSRIEKKLVERVVETDREWTFKLMLKGIGQTFKNEAKKFIFIGFLSILSFILYTVPLFYPIGILLVSFLIAVQFVDYSWSRHELPFGACLKDATKNIFSYTFGGFFFLLLVTIPIINAFVPALATSYFTVLWLHRQKKIPQANLIP
jgi:CysZ protein